MRPSRTARTTAKTTTRSVIDEFKAAEQPKPQESVKAQLLYSIAFTTKFPPERFWNKPCSDGTIRLIGTVERTNNVTRQGFPISNDQLAGLSVEVRVPPDLFEIISDGAEAMIGAGLYVLFEVGEPILSELTVRGEEVNSIVFYATALLGMEVNHTSISGRGFDTKDEMNNWFLKARSQNNDRQKRRQVERTARLQATQAAQAAAAAANNDAEWAATTLAASTNPMD
ncbi:MAG: hypothetical protein IM506_18685 [Microcystis sp. M19BS1]|uniref:hypothetical protein n=1 Tax=Microcystis sp. M19BS1 TaxID=2771180 RepID=UPI002589F215|nr:hypothetical protein [Microcystis sp. M19BS1]MCA2625726.1 hypothetical protein [Microcystis sp. M19BS1]